MIPMIEPTLYIDEQAAIPWGYCERCGGSIYARLGQCLRCERRRP